MARAEMAGPITSASVGTTRDHAVVMGGGIAGLLAARVLADHFARVTLIERDRYPDGPEPRKGVPQGQHVHCLLAKGAEIVARLFPDLMPDLIGGGAVPADMGVHFHWHHHGVWKARFPSGIPMTFFTRPFLESRIAERVRGLRNVQVIEGSVERLLHDPGRQRVVGAAVRSYGAGTAPIQADLVVDATGRGSQVPEWLEQLGHARPAESVVRIDVTYASRLYRAPAKRDWHALHATSTPPDKRHGVIFAVEGDRMLVTLVGFHGERPPGDEAGYLDYVRSLAVPEIHQTIAGAEPLTPITVYRFPANQRRHYEHLGSFPGGLVVLGDAVCSFNPLYGQGMTVSALEVAELDRLLRTPASGPTGVSEQFRRAVGAIVHTPWRLTTDEDFRHPEAVGARPAGTGLLHWYTDRLHRNSAHDPVLALAFYRVMHMLDAPSALFRPRILWHVLRKSS